MVYGDCLASTAANFIFQLGQEQQLVVGPLRSAPTRSRNVTTRSVCLHTEKNSSSPQHQKQEKTSTNRSTVEVQTGLPYRKITYSTRQRQETAVLHQKVLFFQLLWHKNLPNVRTLVLCMFQEKSRTHRNLLLNINPPSGKRELTNTVF